MKLKFFIVICVILNFFLLPICSSISINYSTIDEIDNCPLVLVTGFGPFSNFEQNPSEIIAEKLNGKSIANANIIGIKVFVNLSNFSESIDIVKSAIDEYNPDLIISIGLAASSDWIRIEKIGLNLKREEITENKLSFEKINKDGRWIYVSALPSIEIVKNLRSEGISSRTSLYAGLSLCNAMLYSILEYIAKNSIDAEMGFVHIPLNKSKENPNAMELDTMLNAINITIKASLNN